MKVLGKHVLANLVDCKYKDIENIECIKNTLLECAKITNLHVVETKFHKFQPIGISGVVILKESHITIHTWPEYGFVAIDAFTCGKKMNPENVCKEIAKRLCSRIESMQIVDRGIEEEIENE